MGQQVGDWPFAWLLDDAELPQLLPPNANVPACNCVESADFLTQLASHRLIAEIRTEISILILSRDLSWLISAGRPRISKWKLIGLVSSFRCSRAGFLGE